MEKAIVDAVTAAVNNAVPSAINNAVPAWVNTTFTTLIDQAVEEKCKDKLEQMKQAMEKMEKSMEKKIARSEKAPTLEAKVSAASDMILERHCTLRGMVGSQWGDWIDRKIEQDQDQIRRLTSQLKQIYKEENEENKKEREEKEKAEQMKT